MSETHNNDQETSHATLRLKSPFLPPYWSRLDAYIFAEINYPFWLAMMVYNGIFFIKILSDVSEIGSGAYSIPFKLFVILFISQVPDILFLTTSISFISGSLFAMRRMSTDSEIIAPQSVGLSFWRINRAIFVYGLLLTVVMFVLNNFGAPYLVRLGNESYKSYLTQDAFPNITEGINPLGKGAVMYVDRVEEGMLAGLVIVNRKEQDEQIYLARRASIYTNREVKLVDWVQCDISLDDSKDTQFLDGSTLSRQIPIPTDFRGKGLRTGALDYLNTRQLIRTLQAQGDKASPEMRLALYNRLFTPLMYLILAMFAVPLAARHSRLNSGSGIGLSLLFMGIYFMLAKITGDMVEEGRLAPAIGTGLPLVLFFSVGFVLQVGKNLWWSQYWRKNQGQIAHILDTWFKALVKKIVGLAQKLTPRSPDKTGPPTQTLVFPSKLDIYTMRSFFSIFLAIQVSFLLLFVLVEYIQISGYLRSNPAGGELVPAYFLNKLPTMIDETLFISLLIAILLLFTVMSKNMEVVAIRAGGGSMQRLCVPLVLCGIIISASSFYLENNFLPYTNRNAQTLRNQIARRQDTTFTRDIWLKTGDGAILNYTHYDSQKDRLVDVTQYRVEMGDKKVETIERVNWPILAYDGGQWRVEKPARYRFFDFEDGAAETVKNETVEVNTLIDLAIDMGDLRQRKRKASEFSIAELQEYLQYLKNLGYEEGHYQTELYAKYAKPLIPLFMMLLAMPLGIQVGRRGTFYGVGIGFGAGLSFLGFFELFKEFGASGILNPLVAGWSAVVLFGFVALYRFINLE